jgi:hypothetical protein
MKHDKMPGTEKKYVKKILEGVCVIIILSIILIGGCITDTKIYVEWHISKNKTVTGIIHNDEIVTAKNVLLNCSFTKCSENNTQNLNWDYEKFIGDIPRSDNETVFIEFCTMINSKEQSNEWLYDYHCGVSCDNCRVHSNLIGSISSDDCG